jgi:hypothetical protein
MVPWLIAALALLAHGCSATALGRSIAPRGLAAARPPGGRALSDCEGDVQLPPMQAGQYWPSICSPRSNYAISAALSGNLNGRTMAQVITYGPYCFDFNFSAMNPFQYQSLVGPYPGGISISGLCGSDVCCVLALCLDPLGCDPTVQSITYTPPSATACSLNNQLWQLFFTPFTLEGRALIAGALCLPTPGQVVDFSLANPTGALVTVVAADGATCSGSFVDYDAARNGQLPPGVSAYASVVRTTAPAVAFKGTPCNVFPCCVLVFCHFDGA